MAKKKDVLDGFEQYTSYSRASSPDYAIVREKTQTLAFSGVLAKKLRLGDWTDVAIHFNPETKQIALKRSSPEEYGSRCLRCPAGEGHETEGTKLVCLTGLIKFFNIEMSRAYDPEKIGNKIIILTPVEG